MNEFFGLMLPASVACLILTGIHAYLGLHVLERQVIFVDLALAQIAALGATVGFLIGLELHSIGSYCTSLTFALVGAAIFALTRFRRALVPHEAIIGIVYAVSAAAAILVLSRAPQGGEELKGLMVGHLLFVGWNEIVKVLLIYSIVGILHYIWRKEFILISSNPTEAYRRGLPVRLYDFMFYASFAFVVTSSVELAGVLLVFSFLIVPSVCGILLANNVRDRLAVAWVSGAMTSIVGVVLSYYLDLPTGATVVCTFILALVACAVMRSFLGRKTR